MSDHVVRIKINDLSFNPEYKWYAASISSLQIKPVPHIRIEDENLNVIEDHSFSHTRKTPEPDSEIQEWIYKCEDSETELHILND